MKPTASNCAELVAGLVTVASLPRSRGAMRWMLALSLAGVATAVAATVFTLQAPAPEPAGLPGEHVYQRGAVAWRLQDSQCSSDSLIADLIEQDRAGLSKTAVVRLGTQDVAACWSIDLDGDVIVVDVTGARGFMPRQWFKTITTRGRIE